jgi:hypothetical protein
MTPEAIAAVLRGLTRLIGALAAFTARRNRRFAADQKVLRRCVRKLERQVVALVEHTFRLELEPRPRRQRAGWAGRSSSATRPRSSTTRMRVGLDHTIERGKPRRQAPTRPAVQRSSAAPGAGRGPSPLPAATAKPGSRTTSRRRWRRSGGSARTNTGGAGTVAHSAAEARGRIRSFWRSSRSKPPPARGTRVPQLTCDLVHDHEGWRRSAGCSLVQQGESPSNTTWPPMAW